MGQVPPGWQGEKRCVVLLAGMILFQIYRSLVGGRQAYVTRISGGWLQKGDRAGRHAVHNWSKGIEKEELGRQPWSVT